MKSYINKLMIMMGVILVLSCKNDETKVISLGGTAPVLTISDTSTLVLTKALESYTSLQFQWTNPNYKFSNGPSTQDVFYTLQFDTVGANFMNPGTIAFTNGLSNTFTVKTLNAALGTLGYTDGVQRHFEFRVKTTMANGNVALYSNVIAMKITTYLDVVYPVPTNLYIVGDATPSGWANDSTYPNASQTFTKVNSYTFQLNSLALTANHFLFIPQAGSWSHKYAFASSSSSNNPLEDVFTPDPNPASDFQAPAVGTYKIVVNFKTGKYTMTKL